MKNLFVVILFVMVMCGANAACTVESTTYTACKSGYYLNNNSCTRCPAQDSIYGTTVDRNTDGKTSCYIASGTSFSNSTGVGTYTGNSYWCE
ncbi:MAG: hypothetical protein IJX89_04480 [Alphaproteobacteria bacterium]|nr:hypothetical protein [Alphaproteobacteria bacterium]